MRLSIFLVQETTTENDNALNGLNKKREPFFLITGVIVIKTVEIDE